LTGPQALVAARLIVPLCAPGVVQVNRTATVTLLPGATVTGSAGLVTLNAALLEVIVLMVNGTLPVLLTVNVCVAFCPTQTLPKLSVTGLRLPVACTHVPLTLTVPQATGPHTLSVIIEMFPDCEPGEAHVNRTVTVTLPPAGTVAGNVGLATVNAGLLEVIAVIVNGMLPVLLTVNVRSAL
jgi:hypothetical protein